MSEYKVDYRDLQFVLHEQVKLGELGRFPAFAEFDRETYDIMLQEAVKLCVDVLGPLNGLIDKEELRWEAGKVSTPPAHREAYALFRSGGWAGTTMPAEHGGLGLPWTFDALLNELFSGACCAFTMTPGLTRGAAGLLGYFGSDALKARYLEKMVSGEWTGTMCLTEPQAGSAVGDTKSTAEPVAGTDRFLFRGTKIFISSGEHDLAENIVHMVLGRLPGAPAGVKGLSLFLIPKLRPGDDGTLVPNDVFCSGIEEKLGIHGSPTCTLNFGDNDDCWAWLIGEPQQGMQIMFHMMNEARLGVGIQGCSLANAAYQAALTYARERIQGTDVREMRNVDAPRVPIIEHPDVRMHLLHMRTMAEGMRGLAMKTAYYADVAEHGEGKEKEQAQYCLEVLTPIVKAFCTDQGFRVTERAVQVLGGYGYCREYGVEQYLRDAKIGSIYEGTNGIQALDLVGRKIARKGGAMFMTLLLDLNRFIQRGKKDETLGPLVAQLEKAKNTLAAVTLDFGRQGAKDVFYPVLNATPYLEMFGYVVLGWAVLEQAMVAREGLARLEASGAGPDHPDRAFYGRKLDNARYYVARVLPFVDTLAATIRSGDKSPIETTF